MLIRGIPRWSGISKAEFSYSNLDFRSAAEIQQINQKHTNAMRQGI